MSYSRQTTHYGLPLPTQTDLVNGLDTNDAFEAIDTAIFDAAQGLENATEQLTEINSEITNLQEKDVTIDGQITELQGRMTTAEQTLGEVTEDNEDLADMITAREVPNAQSDIRLLEGEWFRYNGVLYVATTEIAVGDTIVPNVNCRATNVETEVGNSGGGGEVIDTTARDGVSTNASHIGNLANLETDDKTSLVAAINEVLSQIGGGGMPILDYDNPLHKFSTGNLSYTTTKECYLVGSMLSGTGVKSLTINGKQVCSCTSDTAVFVGPLKLDSGVNLVANTALETMFVLEEKTS